ncbi:MAG TPA: YhbY family RNA-binding protein [Burkholderiales bacterium]
MHALSAAERRALKARAHALSPVVAIGNDGLTAAVVAEAARALAAHELIKVRAAGLEREAREAAMTELCAQTGAAPVQHLGKVLVLYRPKPVMQKPRITRPTKKTSPWENGRPKEKPTRSGRRESRSASDRPAFARRPSRPRTSRSARARSGK